MILVIGPRLEGHSVIFLAIQTHPSCRFLLAVDSLGLRRGGSSPQIIDQAKDFPEQFPRHRHLGQLERDVPAMATDCATIVGDWEGTIWGIPVKMRRRLLVLVTLLLMAAGSACAPVDGQVVALPKMQDVVNGEQPDDIKHRHWWKSPGYAMFGGH